MTTNKCKKVTKYRAHTTHGGGHRKKRRGAGNRGGRGNAGSGKRGKAKKPSSEKLGKRGFVPRRTTKKIKVVNVASLNKLIVNKKIEKKDDSYFIDLTSFGYQKLLGTGKTNLKLQIKVNQFSKQAEEKIKTAGGTITPPKTVQKEEPKKSEE